MRNYGNMGSVDASRRAVVRTLPLLVLALAAWSADSEFQIAVDGQPKAYRLDISGGLGDAEMTGRHDLHVGVLADLTVIVPEQGFSDTIFPLGGVGFGYAFRSDGDFRDQSLRLDFHYGLAWRPWKALRFDVQPFLAPQASFVALPDELGLAGNQRDWFLTGFAYGAIATLGVRLSPVVGLAVRGGVEGDYVSGSDSSGKTVTLRDGGAVVGLALVLTSD